MSFSDYNSIDGKIWDEIALKVVYKIRTKDDIFHVMSSNKFAAMKWKESLLWWEKKMLNYFSQWKLFFIFLLDYQLNYSNEQAEQRRGKFFIKCHRIQIGINHMQIRIRWWYFCTLIDINEIFSAFVRLRKCEKCNFLVTQLRAYADEKLFHNSKREETMILKFPQGSTVQRWKFIFDYFIMTAGSSLFFSIKFDDK